MAEIILISHFQETEMAHFYKSLVYLKIIVLQLSE